MGVGGSEEVGMGGLVAFLGDMGLKIGQRSLGSWSDSGRGFCCYSFVHGAVCGDKR